MALLVASHLLLGEPRVRARVRVPALEAVVADKPEEAVAGPCGVIAHIDALLGEEGVGVLRRSAAADDGRPARDVLLQHELVQRREQLLASEVSGRPEDDDR